MGRLEIRVCGARNVANKQKIGKPDPYVKLKMGDGKKKLIRYRTRVVENSLNPIWNELFKFYVADYDSTQVLLELWNNNIVADDLLGSYNLSINGLARGVVMDTWVILTGTQGTCSELHLQILAVDFGRDPAPSDPICTTLENSSTASTTGQTHRPQNNSASLLQVSVPTPPPATPQWQQLPVFYGSSATSMSQAQYSHSAPPPHPPGYGYGVPLPQQPVYGVPLPQPQPVYISGPAPPVLYGPPPSQQRPPQMAYGIPPEF